MRRGRKKNPAASAAGLISIETSPVSGSRPLTPSRKTYSSVTTFCCLASAGPSRLLVHVEVAGQLDTDFAAFGRVAIAKQQFWSGILVLWKMAPDRTLKLLLQP